MYYEYEIQYWQQFSIKSRFWFEMLCNNKSEKFNFEGDEIIQNVPLPFQYQKRQDRSIIFSKTSELTFFFDIDSVDLSRQ